MLFALFLCTIYKYVPFFCMYNLHVLCIVHVLSLFVGVQIKYNVKRLELFKIRRYIKCPLLLLSMISAYNIALMDFRKMTKHVLMTDLL